MSFGKNDRVETEMLSLTDLLQHGLITAAARAHDEKAEAHVKRLL